MEIILSVGVYMAKNLSFSYSKLGMYKECPQKYKFRYVLMLPEKPKYYFAFGTALHAVMEYIYDIKNPAFPTLQQALDFFTKDWQSTSFEKKGYASAEKEAAGYQEGRRIIETYYQKHAATFAHPLSVEMMSKLDTDGLNLISILDRIDYLGDGKVMILDYKTGKTVERAPDQLYMYQKVAEMSPAIKELVQQKDPGVQQVKVEKLCFYHLPTLKEMYFERADDQQITEFWHGVLAVADEIRAGKFSPTPGENQCRWCDYRNICPVFTGKEYTGPGGYGARLINPAPAAAPLPQAQATPAPAPLKKTPQEELSDKIDRCGAALEDYEKLKKEIIALMQAQHFDRHFGAHYQAELKRLTHTQFNDKQKVVELLRSLNLLHKTLVPTQSTVEALLTDNTVPAEQKARLGALGTPQESVELELKKTE